MAKTSYGLKSFKIGPVGSESAALVAVGSTVKGSFSIEGTEAQMQDFFIEENPTAPIDSTVTELPSLNLTGESYDVSPENAVVLMGGTATTAAGRTKYTPPTDGYVPKYVAAEIESAKGLIFSVPNMQIIARPVFAFGTEELAKIVYTGKPVLPEGGGAAWDYSVPTP